MVNFTEDYELGLRMGKARKEREVRAVISLLLQMAARSDEVLQKSGINKDKTFGYKIGILQAAKILKDKVGA